MSETAVRRLAPPDRRTNRGPYPANIPPCPEREGLRQVAHAPRIACCIECGRITSRRWTDPADRSLPWCGGLL